MITETANKKELLTAIEEPVSHLLELMAPLSEAQVNKIPYKHSWTAAQLVRHVTKSIGGLGQAIGMPGKPADRDPGEKIAGLKKVFLDFSTKLQSPGFIVPEAGPYQKATLQKDLQEAVTALKDNAASTDPTELVEGLPLGPTTKLELLHFTVYHTTRHLNQLHRIVDALSEP